MFSELLQNHAFLSTRNRNSETRVAAVHSHLSDQEIRSLFYEGEMSAYVAGSLSRGEVGRLSDLDLFLLTTKSKEDTSRLHNLEIMARIIEMNRTLDYGPFSNDGQYLKVYHLDQMLKALGAPQDDSENLFTARMLLLLESRCVSNEAVYECALDQVLEHYFRDSRGKTSFRPLFMLNDILRYWRTLCLNYELIRDDQHKPWRKKNINLKFSRMLTVFGTVLPMIAKPVSAKCQMRKLLPLSPHERFACGLDMLDDKEMKEDYLAFLDDYEAFLQWKENEWSDLAAPMKEIDQESRETAQRFAEFLHRAVTHEKISIDYRRFLVL